MKRLKNILIVAAMLFTTVLVGQNPGGVGTGLEIWYRADAGTSTTTNGAFLNTWSDQSGNGNNAAQDGNPPRYYDNFTSNINFNPTVDFDGSNDRLAANFNGIKNSSMTLIAVGERDNSNFNVIMGSPGGASGQNLHFGYRNTNQATLAYWGNDLDVSVPNFNTPEITPYILFGEQNATGRRMEEYRNSGIRTSTDNNSTYLTGTTQGYIGDLQSVGNYNGRISEVIAYDRVLTDIEKQKIYSYLAIKYGHTLTNDNNNNSTANEVVSGSVREGDYLASDGTVIWDYAAQGAAYFNNIAGIGRDDNSGLDQRVSSGSNPDWVVALAHDQFAVTNSAHSVAFAADNSFMMWGSNSAAYDSSYTATGAPNGYKIAARNWRVQKTGSFDTVEVVIASSTSGLPNTAPSSSNLYLLIDSDNDFSSGARLVPMTRNGSIWSVRTALGNGEYFTFGRYLGGATLSVTTQGDETGPTNIVYTVTLSRSNNTGTTLTYDISDAGTGTASSGSDYNAIPGSAIVSISNGSTTGTYTVAVNDDSQAEATETLVAYISNPSNNNYPVLVDTATATITDDDPPLPGGVGSNLVFWLKADAGTNTTTDGQDVTSWVDQSGNGNDASDAGVEPVYREVVANFNPGIEFSGSGRFNLSNSSDINTSSSSQKSYSIVFRTGVDITSRQLIFEEGGGTHGLNLYIENGRVHNNLWLSSADNDASTAIAKETTYILTFVYDGNSTRWDGYLNGINTHSDNSAPGTLNAHTGGIGIGEINGSTQYNGNNDVGSGDGFTGHIMEMIYYNAKALTTNERNRMESYLALKYGIGLPGDYLTASNATIWDVSNHTGYTSLVTGIVADATQALLQKQSNNEDSTRLIAIGLDSIYSANIDNTASLLSGSALVWGHNGGSVSFTTVGAPVDTWISDRKWKVEETGSIGPVRLRVPAFTSSHKNKIPDVPALNLLIDSDDDFSTGATVLAMIRRGDYWVADINFSDGDFFAFATEGARLSILTHGDETGPVDIVVQLKLSSPNNSGFPITFDLSVGGLSTAVAGSDYVAIPPGTQFTIPNGDSVDTYTIAVIDDAVDELTDSLQLIVSNPSNPSFEIAVNSAIAEIYDNDESLPAGIGVRPTFWLRADMGTSTTTNGAAVADWDDQSLNNHDGAASGTEPVFRSVVSNFNPAIDFSAATAGYHIQDAPDINTGGGNYSAKSYSIVFKTGADINTLQVIYEQGGSVNGLNLYIESGLLKANWWVSNTDYDDNTSIDPNTTYVCTFIYSGADNEWNLSVNGQVEASVSSVPATLNSHSGDVGVGYIDDDTQLDGDRDISSGQVFKGQIMEMVYYNEHVLTTNQQARLETYLSIKYGVLLQGDFITSDSTNVLWDYSANINYSNNLAAIGFDGNGAILQKQSSSESEGTLLTVGLDTIAVSNATNSANFATGVDYLVWGHNNDTLTGVISNDSIPAESGVFDRLKRLWKMEETGNVGNVKVAFPKDSIDSYFTYFNIGSFHLIVADNADLSLNLSAVEMTTEMINGVNSYVASFDFTGNQYFTVGQKGVVIWGGQDWRGGLSVLVPHGPSDDPLDAAKSLIILPGDTATITEAALTALGIVAAGGNLVIMPNGCLGADAMLSLGEMALYADSTGFGQYKGPPVEATFQQYIDDAGWHLIGSPFSDTKWEDMTFTDSNTVINHPLLGASMDSCTYCNLWWYDTSTDNGKDIGFGTSDAFGTWRSSTDSNENFAPDRGWNLWLDESHGFSSAPWTVNLTGTFNDGDITQVVNENNAGWNLVANPYPSAIDWDVVDDDLAVAGIAAGYHIWDHENTNYAVYASGSGTLGLTQYVAPFQGFYVQTSTAGAQNSGNVYHDFDLQNTDRPDACVNNVGNFYKSTGQNIVLRTVHQGSGKKDETVIKLDDLTTRDFHPHEDIRKLFTQYKDAPSLYSRVASQNLAITAMPSPTVRDSVLVGTVCRDGSIVTIEAIEAPVGYTIYLEDIKTGKWHRIDQNAYSFTQDASLANRFWLHFGPGSIEAKPWDTSNPFSIFVRNDNLVIKTLKSVTSASWYLTGVSGQVFLTGSINEGQGFEHEAYVGHLAPGTYIFRMKTKVGYFAEKIVIL